MTKSKKLKKQGILKPTKTERWKELRKSLYKDNGYTIREAWFKFNEFVDFDERPLHPSQFIPWDKKNNCPLEEPKLIYEPTPDDLRAFEQLEIQYQEAKSEVLFEGFEVVRLRNPNIIRVENNELYLEFYDGKVFWCEGEIKSISDLSGKDIYLTPKGKKDSGL